MDYASFIGVGSSLVETNSFLSATNYLTFALVFVILIHFYMKSSGPTVKRRKGKDGKIEEIYGIDILPGPKPTLDIDIVGNIPQLLPFSQTMKRAIQWSEDHGDVITISGINQKFVGLNSAPQVQAFLKSADFGHVTKSPIIYDLMKPFINNGVLVSKGKFWQHERKILLKSQSFQSLKAYMTLLNKHSKIFVSDLEEMFQDDQPNEINGLINITFLKVISEMITGYDIHGSNEFTEYHHNFQIWKECMVKRLLQPWLILTPIWKLHPMSRSNDKAIKELVEFARRRIKEHRERRAEVKKRKEALGEDYESSDDNDDPDKPPFRSVLDELLDAGVSDDQMVDEVNTMLFGGHETGASTIHCFLFAMALNTEIQAECRKEIDEIFDDPCQFKDGQLIYEAVSGGMKLVERCILETLRLFPPVFIFFRQLKSSMTFGQFCSNMAYFNMKLHFKGKTVELPVGTNVAVCPYTLHRKPEYFPDPNKFDPNRFLPEEAAKRHAYAFVPFSAGPRNCLGLKFAMVEMKVVVAYLLRHFEITTTDKMEDVPLLPYITLTPAKDYTFHFKKRDVNMNL